MYEQAKSSEFKGFTGIGRLIYSAWWPYMCFVRWNDFSIESVYGKQELLLNGLITNRKLKIFNATQSCPVHCIT